MAWQHPLRGEYVLNNREYFFGIAPDCRILPVLNLVLERGDRALVPREHVLDIHLAELCSRSAGELLVKAGSC